MEIIGFLAVLAVSLYVTASGFSLMIVGVALTSRREWFVGIFLMFLGCIGCVLSVLHAPFTVAMK